MVTIHLPTHPLVPLRDSIVTTTTNFTRHLHFACECRPPLTHICHTTIIQCHPRPLYHFFLLSHTDTFNSIIMPLAIMQPLSRPPSRDLALSTAQRLSREETFQLAETARRKSLNREVHDDLRLRLSHEHLLDALLQDIARSERELQTSPTEDHYLMQSERKRPQEPKRIPQPKYDEYGFPMEEDDGEEDTGGLSLTRTQSRRPT